VRHVRRFLLWPLLAACRLPEVREAVERDMRRVVQPRLDLPLPERLTDADLGRVLLHRPFRTILYLRLRQSGPRGRAVAALLRRPYAPEIALEISCDDVGPGLMLMHGFATIVVAERIGADCQVAQQVTVGWSDRGGPPVIGDRVRIGANSVVIGPITVGDDAVVGAGAVVVDDVPPGAVVGGVPARVLAGAADRFSARRG
jgi:serine O-acetyltransferase